MKAPDKIYITEYDIPSLPEEERLSDYWHKTKVGNNSIEYIHKDALLEWAEHHLENLNNINFSEDNYDAGKSHILSDLIDKLNSM